MPRSGTPTLNRIPEALMFQSTKRRLLSKNGQVEHCVDEIEVSIPGTAFPPTRSSRHRHLNRRVSIHAPAQGRHQQQMHTAKLRKERGRALEVLFDRRSYSRLCFGISVGRSECVRKAWLPSPGISMDGSLWRILRKIADQRLKQEVSIWRILFPRHRWLSVERASVRRGLPVK